MKAIWKLMLLISIVPAFAQEASTFIASEGSRIWFEGTSTLHDYMCETDSFTAKMTTSDVEKVQNAIADMAMVVSIPVRSLKSPKGERLEKKMYEHLNANEHPFIYYELESTESIVSVGDSLAPAIHTKGWLSVAGVTRPVEIMVKCAADFGQVVNLTGSIALDMKDFGVDPPKMMLGALRTSKDIVVHFDLVMRNELTAEARL